MSSSESEGRWSSFPLDPGAEHPGRVEVGDDGDVLDAGPSTRVVGMGALCGLRPPVIDDGGRSQSFWVSEFAVLASGRRVILHDERGFTLGSPSGEVRAHLTVETLTRDVLNVVLPDDDDDGVQEAHPWAWLAELARRRGLEVSVAALRSLPYDVVLTDSVTRWLGTAAEAVSVVWRGPFANGEVNALHAEAFETRLFDESEWNWCDLTDRHSLGWVTAREGDELVGFVNVLWDGLVHAWIQDVMVTASARRRGIGVSLVAAARDGARAAGCDYLHVDFDDDLRDFYLGACGFTPTNGGLIELR